MLSILPKRSERTPNNAPARYLTHAREAETEAMWDATRRASWSDNGRLAEGVGWDWRSLPPGARCQCMEPIGNLIGGCPVRNSQSVADDLCLFPLAQARH
jgi:hypothetical protein